MLRDGMGATMLEYGIMVSLIAAVALVAVQTVGQNALALFNTVINAL